MSKAHHFFQSLIPISQTKFSCRKTSPFANNRFFATIKSNNVSKTKYEYQRNSYIQHQRQIFAGMNFSGSSLPRKFSSKSEDNAKTDSFVNPISKSAATSSLNMSSPVEGSLTTMEGMWKESTARLLDGKQTPIGSMKSLQWHLAETLALYWSSSTGPPPSVSNHLRIKHQRGSNNDRNDWFEASTDGNKLSLRILDRLSQEKIAVSNERGTVEGVDTKDDGDFRTIDVSLIHAILKQWKDCLHYANQKNHNRNNQNSLSNHGQNHQQHLENKLSGLLLPSELLAKLESWAFPEISKTSLFDPNIATYTILMDGAVSCRNYRERVTFTEDLLDRLLRECSSPDISSDEMMRLRPTVVTIGTIIHALANSKTNESAEKAEEWLRRIPSLYSEDPIRPNTVVYTTVIRAWADVGRADKAEGLLREMCNDYVGSDGCPGNPDAKPSLWTFNTVLAAWSRSKNPTSVAQAEGLIRTMKSLSSSEKRRDNTEIQTDTTEEPIDDSEIRTSVLQLDVAPTIVSYNSLISTIASRSRQPDSLSRAEYWMEEILANATAAARKPAPLNKNKQQRRQKMGRKNDESMAPNFITYRALFNIIAAARNLSNVEKADRMRYWLARGTSPLLSPMNLGNNTSNKLAEHPHLLSQIEAMEKIKNDET